jgi:Arc/MetJ-type ribon-helix-helix transcriptional regulator
MATIQVELPEEVGHFVSAKVAEGRFHSAGDFIVALLSACRHRETIESKLLAAVENDTFLEVTSDFWDRLRTRAATGGLRHERLA